MLNEQQTSHITSNINFTNHALARKQQRGIKDSWIDLVLEFGHYIYQKSKHAYSVSLDKTGIKRIKETYGNLVYLNKLRRVYVILSEDSAVITCAYR